MPRLVVALLALLAAAPLAHAARSARDVPQLVFPPVDVARLVAEDAARGGVGPVRFAEPIAVAITPETDGAWDVDPDGRRTWQLRIQVPAATDLNLGFTRFELPDGATLTMTGEEDDRVLGPYGSASATAGQLWTPVVLGDGVLITMSVPRSLPDPRLEIGQVGAGYRHFGREAWHLDTPCTIDVVCPEGDPWRDEIDSVAMYSLNGTWKCSGTLVTDVQRSCTPWFLTAAHCNVDDMSGNTMAASVVVYFNYQVAQCGGPRGAPLNQSIPGSILRARRTDVDLCLLELSAVPPAAFFPYWAGWDRTDVPPSASVHIHHPNIDEKEIAFNDDPLTHGDSCLSAATNTHWLVDDYERGITEAGSSGSGIWSVDNHRLVGWLSGGTATCFGGLDGFDCYGRFAVGWDGPSRATRLRDWLDPDGLNPPGMDGRRAGIMLGDASITDDCALGGPGDGNGAIDPGETFTLATTLIGCSDFIDVAGTLTSTTPGVSFQDDTATWRNLISQAPSVSLAPHFTASVDTGVPCGTQLDFVLTVTTGQGGPFEFPFSVDMASQPTCEPCGTGCVAREIANVSPDLLSVRKGAPGIVVLTYPQATWCGGAIQVRMADTSRPATRPGSWPDDPMFADVTSLDQQPGPDFAIDPPDDNRYFLVVETNADGTPGPSGSY